MSQQPVDPYGERLPGGRLVGETVGGEVGFRQRDRHELAVRGRIQLDRNEATQRALARPDLEQAFSNQGASPTPGSPEALRAQINAELKRWGAAAKAAGVSANQPYFGGAGNCTNGGFGSLSGGTYAGMSAPAGPRCRR